MRIDQLQAASWWEKLKALFDSPLALTLLAVCAVLFIAIVCLIAVLSRRIQVTYVSCGKEDIRSYYKGARADQSAPEQREGYRFGGWYLDETCTKKAPETLRVKKKGIVLYALWEKEEDEEAAAEPVTEETAVVEEPVTEETAVVEEPVAKEPAAEPVPEEPAQEEAEEEEDETEAAEGDEFDNALVTTVTGTKVFVQYRRSFTARLIQADDEIKDIYNTVRNALLTVSGVKERTSWNYNSINRGRKQFAKINANRKSLILYLALSPSNIEDKYRFRDVSEKKRYKDVPVRYKITGSRSLQYALELIEQAADNNGLTLQEFPFEQNLSIPYEPREDLIKKKLIKVYAKKDSGETITEEQLEEFIEEGATVESLSSFTVTDKVSVLEAEKLVSDATAKQLMALADEVADNTPRVAQAKRGYINLDTIAANFKEDEIVNLQTLKEKKLVQPKMSAVKVLARGSLDKALTVEAADFSLPAVKMIVITGGKVVKLKKV